MGQLALGIVLLIAGSWLAAPPIILLGLVLAAADGVRQLWLRQGLVGVTYSRRLARHSVVVGDELAVDVTVWNRKSLPLSWLRADDYTSQGVTVRERGRLREPGARSPSPTGLPGDASAGVPGGAPEDADLGREVSLVNVWSLAPYERVTRHFHLVAERRGVYTLGPVDLEAGDLLARLAAAGSVDTTDTWLVRPRCVPVAFAERDDPWGGERRARTGRIADPALYAGVRPYQPGDPLRSIHWRATARTGTPVSRIFEPARHREAVVVLDLQTVEGSRWATSYDDDAVEALCVAAASLVRRLRDSGAEVGIAATGYATGVRPFGYVAPGASSEQVGRCLDLLARLGSMPAAPVERVLTTLLRILRPGTSLILVTTRLRPPVAAVLRRIASAGFPVQVVALETRPEQGSGAATPGLADPVAAATAVTRGVETRIARLDGPWHSATTMVVT